MNISINDFVVDLQRAFPNDYPVGLQIVSHSCGECEDLASDFEGREWASISESLIEKHYTEFSLFTPNAFKYFLPAFLRVALTEPNSNTPEFLMMSLAPSGLHNSELLTYSRPQRDLVVRFLDLMVETEVFIRDKVWEKTRTRWQVT